ncbi:MAG: type II toxin-antitoxin system RelE/ParE family toxin [Nostoc sp. DedQUE12b]|uniref:type II toxin-antitoxin system RelE/ParE family toxin n=1 Tax=Nostoc sp. DedQUE12b TaxID=3075398 RepID=UPI002AD37A00|nr:type II toxin-antitoxin system RelE/ParE family toxin [Nostoc sp. DedQUE12b]MDZ8089063.1 type II toxin-antitoxin system RelE/ParE family toxin [Nostoc sp. DedQUE12b]
MIIYKTRWFDRWARKEGLNDLSLCAAVNEMTAGLYEVDLGGGLFKKRIARSGQGKRGGFRTLVATNKGDCWFFVFGFPKNQRSNINKKEEKALKKLASVLFSYTLEDLEKAKLEDELMEVICNGEEEINDS